MYFVNYCGKLLLHSEICDFNSLIPEKQLDIKKDKSIVKKLFGKLGVTNSAKSQGGSNQLAFSAFSLSLQQSP
jgi:hypothetical protein